MKNMQRNITIISGVDLLPALLKKYGRSILLYGLLLYFSWLMLDITLQYIPIRLDVAFLKIKQDVIHLPYYRIAFFTHVFTAMLALLAGFTQFSEGFRIKNLQWHKRIGKVYFYTVVLFAGPSGLIMGYHANGGITSQLAFCLLAILWITFTLIAVDKVRHGDINAHKKWMMRSYALTLSAVTLRLWKLGIVVAFEPHPMDVYRIAAWLGWALNLVVAECMIVRMDSKKNASV